MHEIAAKQVLLDFEIIALIALAVGIAAFAIARKLRGRPPFGVGDYDGYDLVLMLFPAMLFLFNPLFELFLAKSESSGEPAAEPSSAAGTMIVNLVYFAFVGTMTYGILEWVRGRRVADLFGFGRRSFPVVLFAALAAGILSVAICAKIVGDFSANYLDGLFTELAAQDTVESLQATESVVYLVLTIVMACIAAPFVEEMLFRGYLYGVIKQATHPIFAAAVVGALFAVVHGNLPALLPLWAFSILLCLAYEWSGSLWVPIGMHAVFNGANIMLMRFVPAG